ncbi:MAG: hypothetical protein IJD91_00135 [Clostridia bacterium]|nr:hypothetical protein [Clostridia bacterium]
MKKLLALLLTIVMLLAFPGCGAKKEDIEENSETDVIVSAQQKNKASEEEVDEEPEQKESTGEKEWRKFLEDYENWVDDYIKILKKYEENPTDLSILSDYADMMLELADWEAKTEKMEEELENASPGEVAEYSAELLRIAAKMAEVID